MSKTISFLPLPAGSVYTPAQLNALFASVATVIAGKLDADGASLTALTNFNGNRLLNLQEGGTAYDAITVGQAKAILGTPPYQLVYDGSWSFSGQYVFNGVRRS